MIKINLLESVTDRPQGVAAVEDKVASRGMQTLLLALTVLGLTVVAMGYDYVSSNMARTAAQKELEDARRDLLNQLQYPLRAVTPSRSVGEGGEDLPARAQRIVLSPLVALDGDGNAVRPSVCRCHRVDK